MSTKDTKISEKIVLNYTGKEILEENQEKPTKSLENVDNSKESNDSFQETSDKREESIEKSRENKEESFNYFSESQEKELKSLYPSVNLDNLKKNAEFCSLLETISKKPSLLDVYSAFLSIAASFEEKAMQKAMQAVANAQASVGSLSSNQESKDIFFTKEQVLQMSPEQIRKNYLKIRQSQEKW